MRLLNLLLPLCLFALAALAVPSQAGPGDVVDVAVLAPSLDAPDIDTALPDAAAFLCAPMNIMAMLALDSAEHVSPDAAEEVRVRTGERWAIRELRARFPRAYIWRPADRALAASLVMPEAPVDRPARPPLTLKLLDT